MRVSARVALAALALLSAALATPALDDAGAGETLENEPPQFHAMGSRYGRADRHIQTRDPGMFLLPRYGKRAAVDARGRPLLCEYTGLDHLYRCFNTYNR